MDRRTFLQVGLLGSGSAFAGLRQSDLSSPQAISLKPFDLAEAAASDLQAGMTSGKYTARSIAEKYLERIGQIDKGAPAINSIIEINPDALAIAGALDNERKAKGPRGP